MRNLLAISLLNALFISASYAQGDCQSNLTVPNFDKASSKTPVCLFVSEVDDNQKTNLNISYRDKDNRNGKKAGFEQVGEKKLGKLVENDGFMEPDFTMLDTNNNKLLTTNRDWTLFGDLSAKIYDCNGEKILGFHHDIGASLAPGYNNFSVDDSDLHISQYTLLLQKMTFDLKNDKEMLAQATLVSGSVNPAQNIKEPDQWTLCLYSPSQENLSTLLMMLVHQTDERNEKQVSAKRQKEREAKQAARRKEQEKRAQEQKDEKAEEHKRELQRKQQEHNEQEKQAAQEAKAKDADGGKQP